MATYITRTGKIIDDFGKVVGVAPAGTTGAFTEGVAPNPSYVAPKPKPEVSVAMLDRTIGVGKLGTAQEELAKASSEEAARQARQEADLYAAQMRQARIDAINQAFAPRIKREEKAGAGRIARVEAMNFKRGIVGSGADTTKLGEQEKLNKEALEAIESEKAILINDAFNMADSLAAERAKLLTEEKKGAAQANVDLYTAQANKAIEVLQSFGQSGGVFSIEDIKNADPNAYNTLRDILGYSDEQMMQILDKAKPRPTNINTSIQNGYLVATYYDPATGQFKSTTQKLDLPEGSKEANLQAVKADNGLVYVLDMNTGKVVNTFGDKKGPTGNQFEIPKQARNNLLKFGFTTQGIDALQKDIQTYGLKKAMEGLPEEQATIIQRELDKEYLTF